MKKNLFALINFKKFLLIVLFILFNFLLFSTPNNTSTINISFTDKISTVILSLGVLIIIAKLSEILSEKIKIPPILIQLLIGIAIGPYLLGNISIPWLNHGIFSIYHGNNIPISPELFGILLFASIIILFNYGLSSDTSIFAKFTNLGLCISLISSVLTFLLCLFFFPKFLNISLNEPKNLILAIALSSTSFGLFSFFTFNKKEKVTSEKVIILTTIILENIFVIIGFTIALYFIQFGNYNFNLFKYDTNLVNLIIKVIFILMLFFILLIIFVIILNKLGKSLKNWMTQSIFVFGLFLLMTGLFHFTGINIFFLAFFIGLIISKTNFYYLIYGYYRTIFNVFNSLFFILIGMLIDYKLLFSLETLYIALIITAFIILLNIISPLITSLFFNFKFIKSTKIGLSLIPRGEVGLIIGAAGLSLGIINLDAFTFLFIVILFSILFLTLFNPVFNLIKLKKDEFEEEVFNLESSEIAHLITYRLLDNFNKQGFSINIVDLSHRYYILKRNDLFFILNSRYGKIIFNGNKKDLHIIKILYYEIVLDLNKNLNHIAYLKESEKKIINEFERIEQLKNLKVDFKEIINENNIILDLKAINKLEVLEEMLNVLAENGYIKDKKTVLNNLNEREKLISTGMQQGIAIPHCKTKGVEKISIAVGFKKDGIEFDSIDGQKSNIFIMILTPDEAIGSHIKILMMISSIFLYQEKAREKLLKLKTKKEICDFFISKCKI